MDSISVPLLRGRYDSLLPVSRVSYFNRNIFPASFSNVCNQGSAGGIFVVAGWISSAYYYLVGKQKADKSLPQAAS